MFPSHKSRHVGMRPENPPRSFKLLQTLSFKTLFNPYNSPVRFVWVLFVLGGPSQRGGSQVKEVKKGPKVTQPAKREKSWNLNSGSPLQGQCPFLTHQRGVWATQREWRHPPRRAGDGKPNPTGPWGIKQETACAQAKQKPNPCQTCCTQTWAFYAAQHHP